MKLPPKKQPKEQPQKQSKGRSKGQKSTERVMKLSPQIPSQPIQQLEIYDIFIKVNDKLPANISEILGQIISAIDEPQFDDWMKVFKELNQGELIEMIEPMLPVINECMKTRGVYTPISLPDSLTHMEDAKQLDFGELKSQLAFAMEEFKSREGKLEAPITEADLIAKRQKSKESTENFKNFTEKNLIGGYQVSAPEANGNTSGYNTYVGEIYGDGGVKRIPEPDIPIPLSRVAMLGLLPVSLILGGAALSATGVCLPVGIFFIVVGGWLITGMTITAIDQGAGKFLIKGIKGMTKTVIDQRAGKKRRSRKSNKKSRKSMKRNKHNKSKKRN